MGVSAVPFSSSFISSLLRSSETFLLLFTPCPALRVTGYKFRVKGSE
jgi:hypothetical protein